MSSTTLHKPAGVAPAEAAATTKPVKWWAFLGAAILALQISVLTAWVISGNAKPTPKGPTPIPHSHIVLARMWEAIGVLGAVAFIGWFVIRPLRRDGRLSLDGMLVLVCVSLWFQDPFLNYVKPWFAYSAAFVNLGSWASNIPGWMSPNGHYMPEPLLFVGGLYVWMFFGFVLLGNWVLGRIRRQWPGLGRVRAVLVLYALIVVTHIIGENLWLRMGLYSYAGGMRSLSFFPNEAFKYPVYEGFISGAAFTVLACVRHFRDDRGLTVAERGIEEVSATPRQKQGLRFLSLVGIWNVLLFAFMHLPFIFFGLHADTWPKDIQNRSYMSTNLCGPFTDYACPGPDVPIPHGRSLHLGPDGTLRGTR